MTVAVTEYAVVNLVEDVGPVMPAEGAVVSGAAIVHVKDCEAVRIPAAVGVPEMKPVD